MNKLTKQNIEQLAKEIMTFLESYYIASSVNIYYNNKVVRSNTNYDVKTDKFSCSWITEENVDPHNYLEYAAYEHILSMSFEGGLYDVLNYTFGSIEEKFNAIFDKYGLYFELGNSWNLSVYTVDDNREIEYTYYKRPKPTINLYRWKQDNPKELQSIMDEWYTLSSLVGDQGSCVLGAGFGFEWRGDKYFMCACSPWQGSLSWEQPKDKIEKMLKDIGATEIYYDWGRID